MRGAAAPRRPTVSPLLQFASRLRRRQSSGAVVSDALRRTHTCVGFKADKAVAARARVAFGARPLAGV